MMIHNQDISPFDYVNITCRKGDGFLQEFEYLNDDDTNFDFTGYTAKLQVRRKETAEFVEEFTTEDGSIVLEPGNITLTKDSITGASGKYLCDLQLTIGGRNRTIASGDFTILPDFTI